jgi:aminoglycoside phosphotransferase (APT) family kinase protein
MDYDLIIERSQESTLRNWIANVRDEVRAPKPGRVMFMEKQVRDTVAVMKKIQSTTRISVPSIIAFGTAEDNVGGFGPFMINEFVFGGNLAAKLFDNPDEDFEESIYRQIAGFLLELSGCRFHTIGSLSMDNHGDNHTWPVKTRPLTWLSMRFLGVEV